MKQMITVICKLVLLTFLLNILLYYFGIWFVAFPLWALGLVLAFFITKSYWSSTLQKMIGIPLIVVAYILTFPLFFKQISHRVYPMEWESQGINSYHKKSEVLLRFADHPHHVNRIYSNTIADYLESLPSKTVEVTFRESREFGCYRGGIETKIGDLSVSYEMIMHSSSGREGSVDQSTPRPDPWWCRR